MILNFRDLPKPDFDLAFANCDFCTEGVPFLDTYDTVGELELLGPV